MSDERGYKEVDYEKYCKLCEHKDTKEFEDPCNECLDNPTNLYSRKPIKYKEKEQK